MAKKVVATLKTGKGHAYTKIIKFVKSKKTGAYSSSEEIINKEHVNEYFAKK